MHRFILILLSISCLHQMPLHAKKIKKKAKKVAKLKSAKFSSSKTKLSADISLSGNYLEDKQVEARIFGVAVDAHLTQDLLPKLKAQLSIGANLETGSSNSLGLDEYVPNNEWVLNEGYIQWKPFHFFTLKGGAINQGAYQSPLLLSNAAFLSTSQEIYIRFNEDYDLYFKAAQSIPNNNNLTKRVGSVQEGTPTFFMETVGLDLKGNVASFKLEVSQFAFDKLSNDVAYRSQFIGNSIGPNSETNSQFVYQFKGYNLNGELDLNFDEFYGLSLKGQYLFNDQAPDGLNTGILYHIGLKMGAWRPYLEFFQNDSDSSPAYYSSRNYGHNNKEGLILGISSKSIKDKIQFNLNYADLREIKDNIYQSDSKRVSFSIIKSLEL